MAYRTQTRFALSSSQRDKPSQQEVEAAVAALCERDNAFYERFVLLAIGLDLKNLIEFLAPPHEIALSYCYWVEESLEKAHCRRSLLAILDPEGHSGYWIIQCTQEEVLQLAAE